MKNCSYRLRYAFALGWGVSVGVGNAFAAEQAVPEEVYLAPAAFVSEAFSGGEAGRPEMFWLTQTVKPEVRAILGHDYPGLRLRYWRRDERTAWILEEIGKVKPITTGVVVEAGEIVRLQVLVYRESHGWEVKHPFFTDQFKGITLRDGTKLSEPIDGITGATMSVNALRKLSRLALYLDQCVQASDGS